MPHEFTISVSQLDAGGKEFHFPVRAAWLRGALEGCDATATGADGKLDIRASKSGDDIVVHGELEADLTLTCARCLGPAPMHFKETVTALAVPGRNLALTTDGEDEEEADVESSDADVMPYEGETLVLDDLVRDTIVLEIPLVPLCSEDCPGITPPPQPRARDSAPVAEASIDPRLAPLLRLKKMTETKE